MILSMETFTLPSRLKCVHKWKSRDVDMLEYLHSPGCSSPEVKGHRPSSISSSVAQVLRPCFPQDADSGNHCESPVPSCICDNPGCARSDREWTSESEGTRSRANQRMAKGGKNCSSSYCDYTVRSPDLLILTMDENKLVRPGSVTHRSYGGVAEVLRWLLYVSVCIFLILPPAQTQILPRSTYNEHNPLNATLASTAVPLTTKSTNSKTSLNQTTRHLMEHVLAMKDSILIQPNHLSSAHQAPRNAFLLDSFLLRSSSAHPGVSGRQLRTDTPIRTMSITWDTVPVTLPMQTTLPLVTPVPGATLTTPTGQPLRSTRSATKRQPLPRGRQNSFFLDEEDGWLSRLDDIGPLAPDFQSPAGFVDSFMPPATTNWPPLFTPMPVSVDGSGMGPATEPAPGMFIPLNYTSTDHAGETEASVTIPGPFRPFTATSLQNPVTIPPFASPVPATIIPGISNASTLRSPPDTTTNEQSIRSPRPVPPAFRTDQPPRPNPAPPFRYRPADGETPDQRMRGSVLPAPNPYAGSGNERLAAPPFRRPNLPPSRPEVLPPNYPTNRGPPPAEDGVKLETCTIGDDSTCNQETYEVCKREDGVSTCVCRSGTARRNVRDPCQGVLNYYVYVRMNRFYDRQLTFGPQFADNASYPYNTLAREVALGIDTLLSETDLSTAIVSSKLNSFAPFADDLLANTTVTLLKSRIPLGPNDLGRHLQEIMLDSLRRNERRLGKSRLFVGNFLNAVPGVQDIDECMSPELNDCNTSAVCTNTPGTYTCACKLGYGDRFASDPVRAGRSCEPCEESYCNNHGVCLMTPTGKTCQCAGWYIGATCQTDGQVVAVACGSSAVAVILIAVTLVFLLRWSRNSTSTRGLHLADQLSTLARSEISANTFTYFKVNTASGGSGSASISQSRSGADTTAAPDNDRSGACTTHMDCKQRMACLVHPNLTTQPPAYAHRCQCSDGPIFRHRPNPKPESGQTACHNMELMDNHLYEVRPPGKLAITKPTALSNEVAGKKKVQPVVSDAASENDPPKRKNINRNSSSSGER